MNERIRPGGHEPPLLYEKYSLEILEYGGVFHWLVTRRETLAVLIVGEQKTRPGALDEAVAQIRYLQSQDAAALALQRVPGA